MGDKSCYLGTGGYSGYMGSGTQGTSYAREEYAGNLGGGGGYGGGVYAGGGLYNPGGGYAAGAAYSSGTGGAQPPPPEPPKPAMSSNYAGNVGGSEAQASCYFAPK